ncbi:hypothetical protein AB0J83_20470 [Actinoplanes sp. NPDC049596]|uniref:hypothetical protein n=1 Tax=unclassified Actinoplanes TaxID=2626549 RepID=UPI003448E691
MTTTGDRRTLLLRSLLSVLLFVLLAQVATPQRPSATSSPRAAVSSSAVSDPSSSLTEPDESAESEQAPIDRATVLSTQFTAGVRGSRAPPAASA